MTDIPADVMEAARAAFEDWFSDPITRSTSALVAARAIMAERERCARIAEALQAENARLRAASQWQPIETAPKDGALVLLSDEATVFVGSFCWSPMRKHHEWWSHSKGEIFPTRWMLIPPPNTKNENGDVK